MKQSSRHDRKKIKAEYKLDPAEDARFDRSKELAFMEQLWMEKLRPFGDRGYNERKLNRQELLRRIAGKP